MGLSHTQQSGTFKELLLCQVAVFQARAQESSLSVLIKRTKGPAREFPECIAPCSPPSKCKLSSQGESKVKSFQHPWLTLAPDTRGSRAWISSASGTG